MKPLRPDVIRGFCYAHVYRQRGERGYGSDSSALAKKELQRLGVEWVSLTPFGFVRTSSSTDVMRIEDMMQLARAKKYLQEKKAQGETDDVVRAEIAQALSMGFKVQLKPHIWMLDQSWRGQLDPGSPSRWAAFWKSYRRFILHYADMAEATGVHMLVIGTELDQTVVDHEAQWRQLIAAVRARYKGQLTYASNWDAYPRVPFWHALDFVGVQFYPPLAEAASDSTAAMAQRLDTALEALGAVARDTDKPVLLTEVGYRAVRGTAVHPHEWPDPNDRNVDGQAQARAYRVLLQGVRDRPFIAGLFLWKWYTDIDGDEGPAGFSPREKPAAELIGQAFRR